MPCLYAAKPERLCNWDENIRTEKSFATFFYSCMYANSDMPATRLCICREGEKEDDGRGVAGSFNILLPFFLNIPLHNFQ